MGKASKKKRAAQRFDPLARPAASTNAADDDMDGDRPAKQMSAHRARHLERKRLQAETLALKSAKKKISKADKLNWQREQRALSKTLKASKAALHVASSHGLAAMAEEGNAAEEAMRDAEPAAPAFAGFSLAAPRAVNVGESWFANTST